MCQECIVKCLDCGGPTRQSGGKIHSYCTDCIYKKMRVVEQAAKAAIGNCCARCKIEHPLQWDHVLNDPVKPGGRLKRQGTFNTEYAEISKIARGEESSRLQLLCPNCNWLKEHDLVAYLEIPTYGPVESRYKM